MMGLFSSLLVAFNPDFFLKIWWSDESRPPSTVANPNVTLLCEDEIN